MDEKRERDVQLRQLDANESKREDGRGHRPEGGVRAAARDLGINESSARRAVKINSITAEAKARAIEYGIDTQSALERIARGGDRRSDQWDGTDPSTRTQAATKPGRSPARNRRQDAAEAVETGSVRGVGMMQVRGMGVCETLARVAAGDRRRPGDRRRVGRYLRRLPDAGSSDRRTLTVSGASMPTRTCWPFTSSTRIFTSSPITSDSPILLVSISMSPSIAC